MAQTCASTLGSPVPWNTSHWMMVPLASTRKRSRICWPRGQRSSPLSGRDFPPDLLDRWPRGQQILLRFRVDANGAIIQCDVFQGSGDPSVDAQVCAIARQRLRYRPGLDASRQRVADWAAYRQTPPR